MEITMATPKEAVWNALLEMEPRLAQMEEPDVPRLTAKLWDELRLRGFRNRRVGRSRSRQQRNR